MQVNATYLSNAFTPTGKPWLDLGKQLGRMALNLVPKVTDITLTLRGPAVKPHGELLQAALLSECLAPQGANLVNATSVASKVGVGVTVTTATSDEGDDDVVDVKVTGGHAHLRGTVLGGRPFLVSIYGEDVGYVELKGTLAVLRGQSEQLATVLPQLNGVVEDVHHRGNITLLRLKSPHATNTEMYKIVLG